MPAEWIELGPASVRGGRLTVTIAASRRAARYLSGAPFVVDYGDGVDLGNVPSGILAIPGVGNLAPVAWALGAELRTPVLDAEFAQALPSIAAALQRIYPFLQTGRSRVVAGRIEDRRAPGAERIGMLYSGGVDSNAALIAHRRDVTDLIAVWGADVDLGNAPLWQRLVATLETSPPAIGKHLHLIRSNLRHILDNEALARSFGSHLATGGWWGGIQHGTGLLTLCAPLAFHLGIGTLMEASSYTETPDTMYAFGPEVDERVTWAGTNVRHVHYDLTRQDKIANVIAPWMAAGNTLPLAVCYKATRSATTMNCGRCEKCARTHLGLLLAGIDPANCGLSITPGWLDEVAERMERRMWVFDSVQLMMWRDIQRAIPTDLDRLPDTYDCRRFFTWLRSFDLTQCSTQSPFDEHPFPKAVLIHAARGVLAAAPPLIRERVLETIGQRQPDRAPFVSVNSVELLPADVANDRP